MFQDGREQPEFHIVSGLVAVMLLAQKEQGGMTSDSVALKGGASASLCFGMAPMACSSSCFSRKGFSMALTRRQARSCVNQAESTGALLSWG